MRDIASGNKWTPELQNEAEQTFASLMQQSHRNMDIIFGGLLVFEFLLGILFAVFISPKTWNGQASQMHIHVIAAVFIGALIFIPPLALIIKKPGAAVNGYIIAVAQISFSILFIHLTGGRIETHFHIFGSLAFLAFYRNWKLIAVGTLVTLFDHIIRGYLWPESVYGVLYASPLRAFEHAAWVAFEDTVLLFSIFRSRKELFDLAVHKTAIQKDAKSSRQKAAEIAVALDEANSQIDEQRQNLFASSKLSALGEMSAGIAHEINNPLAIISGKLQQIKSMTRRENLDPPTVLKHVEAAEKTVERISKIITGLRRFSRDCGHDQFETATLRTILEDTLSLCEARFKNHDVKLRFPPLETTEIALECRSTQISQVLLNLLNNAFDAIAECPDRWINVDFKDAGNSIEVSVTDCGHGIPLEIQEKIMQPFFTTKEIGKGTGLGLSISTGIAKSHGGELKLDRASQNTRFILKLPKKQKKKDAA